MKTVELEVEKIRAVRYRIGQQFQFNAAKLGEYYREQEVVLKTAAHNKALGRETTASVKESPQDQ
jgi:hypothetical protein